MRQAAAGTRAVVRARSSEVARLRLERHHLVGHAAADAVTLCRDICGAQAQVMTAAFLQLWTRNHAIRRGEIEAALWKSRTLVRTSLMRQTLHLIPAEEFPIHIAALRRSRVDAVLRVMARFGVTRGEADVLTQLIMEVVASGPRGHAEIRSAAHPRVSKRMRAWMAKVSSIVRVPIAEGLLCYGSGEGNQVKFARADSWLPVLKPCPLSEAEAQCFLLRKYLRAYGPATLSDFAHWSGIPVTQVRPLRALIGEEALEIDVEDQGNCLIFRDDLELLKSKARKPTSVRLLPYFDPYLLAHRAKEHLIESKHYKSVYRSQWWISPVLLVDGMIAGTWSHKLQGSRVQVIIEPFAKLARATREATIEEAEGLAGFLGGTLELMVRGPTVEKK